MTRLTDSLQLNGMAGLALKDFIVSKGYYILQFGDALHDWIVALAEKDRSL